LTSGRRPVVKIIAESLSPHDEKYVVPTPLSGTRVGGRRIKVQCNDESNSNTDVKNSKLGLKVLESCPTLPLTV
jgi:hypothetical protein